MAFRAGRIKSVISRDIADIVRSELKNPKLGLVCVNEVDINDDYSRALVYVSFLGAKYPKQAFEELKKTTGYVRSSLAKKLDIYKVPEIVFVYDDSFDRAEKIENLLASEEEAIKNAKK